MSRTLEQCAEMRLVNHSDPQAVPRIFVSYARVDGEEAARELVALLEEHRLAAWFDHLDLEGGDDWWRQVEASLQRVEHLVLLLSPAALRSPHVEREWRYARRQGVQVSPVASASGLDASRLPRWMQRAHRPSLAVAEQRQRLLHVLEGPGRTARVPFMAASPEAGFVPRPEELAALKQAVLGGGKEPVAITAALRGAGGFGKTELARFLCNDDDVEEAFDGGILWATLGETPANPVATLADLSAALSGRTAEASGLDAAKAALAEALDDRACLLVIDDVWRRRDVEPLLHRGPHDRTTRLITTRDDSALPRDAVKVPVDAMRPSEAIALLTRGLPPMPALQQRIAHLAQRRFGGWPLLLSQANALLRDRVERGDPPERAFDYLERSLAKRGIAGTLRADDEDDRRRSASGTLDVSLAQLSSDQERERYGEMGVFAEDAEISLDSVVALWGRQGDCDEFEAEDLCIRLRRLSLVRDLDLGRRTLRLHDVHRSLLRERLGNESLCGLEAGLVKAWGARCAGKWSLLADPYALRFLPTHLASAGRADELENVLLDVRWMLAKVADVGAPALLADYRAFAGDPRSAPGLVGRAFELAVGSLADELPAQLLGRLSPTDALKLAPCLEAAQELIPVGGLVPLRPTLTPPGLELRRFEAPSPVIAVAVLSDDRHALSGHWDRTLRLWDLDTGQELRRVHTDHHALITAVAVLSDGRRALSGSLDCTLRLWDLETGDVLRRFERHSLLPVTAAAVLSDGRRALWGSSDGSLRLRDLDTGQELRSFDGHTGSIKAVAVLSDGRRALSGSDDRTLRLWDLDTGQELRCLRHGDAVTAVSVLSDDRRAFSASDCLRLWDLDTGEVLRRFSGYDVKAVAVLNDGRRALSGSEDRAICLWDLDSGQELRRIDGHGDSVSAIAALRDGRRALSGSEDRTLRLWGLDINLDLRRVDTHHGGTITAVAVLSDGRRALSGSRDRTLRLWDLDAGQELRRFEGHMAPVTAVTVLSDGRHALSGSWDRTLRLWDLDTGQELHCFDGHEDLPITAAAVLGDGRRALSGYWDGKLHLFDLDTGQDLHCFDGHTEPITAITVLSDGRRVLSGSEDRTLRLWDLDSGQELRRIDHGNWPVNSVAVLGNGHRVLSGSDSLRLWDLDTGRELRRFDGHTGLVTGVAVLSDGRRTLSASDDRTLRLWDLDTCSALATLHIDVAASSLAVDCHDRAVIGDILGRLHWIAIKR